ncbi:hypothetical protein J2T02_002592 [Chitinophaga terrae (ex Kim and Jung 2007)]|uniref:hypothetical protein n=1 Tax=Chitinophaga terrae (ex Kim and Jung 2007) TaxID=408074 RepID=UPI002789C17C|nr:hypothetical protein [Chitinophaga terrae (ex Kim and Jung 2007)]MDQ0107473.1 hypothetical protein [Chitinophaga terrae (ex Kim and Jung 2007)]
MNLETRLPDFIREKVKLAVMAPQVEADEIKKWIGFIEIAADMIVKQLKHEVLCLDSEKKVELFIQNQQFSLIETLNLVNYNSQAYKGPDPPSPSLAHEFYAHSIRIVQDILQSLESLYPTYFNYDMQVPASLLNPYKAELGEKFTAFKGRVLNMETSRLIRVLSGPLEDFLEEDYTAITYKQLQYFKTLIGMLYELKPGKDPNCQIRTIMANMNFNATGFFDYMCSIMNDDLEALDTIAQKLEKLAWFEKNLGQLVIKPGMVLYPKDTSLVDYLLSYVRREAAYLQSIVPPANTTPDTFNGQEDGKSFKVETSLTISLLAALLKLLVDTGILKNNVIRGLMRFFSQHFRTSKRESIDFETFRTQYYSVDAGTKSALISLCKKLLENARELE